MASSEASNLTPVYRNPARPIPERVQDLLSRLSLTEKISQMCNATDAVPRQGIPAYDFWNEALHGVARNGRATVFPQAIGMAATWDTDLVHRIAAAIGDEARAKHHAALRRNGQTSIYQGLTFWSPNINIFRDPRWGRGQETWGEDPHLTGEMGAAFVRGLQGDHPKYLKIAACAKHFAVHSGPEKDRHTFNAVVSPRVGAARADLHYPSSAPTAASRPSTWLASAARSDPPTPFSCHCLTNADLTFTIHYSTFVIRNSTFLHLRHVQNAV